MNEINRNTDRMIDQIFHDTQDPIIHRTIELPYDERLHVLVTMRLGRYLMYSHAPKRDRTLATLTAENDSGILYDIHIGYPHIPVEQIFAAETEKFAAQKPSNSRWDDIQLRPADTKWLKDGQVFVRTDKTDLRNGHRRVGEPLLRYGDEPERAFINLARLARMLAYVREEEHEES